MINASCHFLRSSFRRRLLPPSSSTAVFSSGGLKALSTENTTVPISGNTIFEVIKSKELQDLDISYIRNFSVIAHVDHGKSTLSDCILQLTGNITEQDRKKGQVCDTLKVERERGITVKAQTASMIYVDKRTNLKYLFNLIDTPGQRQSIK
jgi:GTPase